MAGMGCLHRLIVGQKNCDAGCSGEDLRDRHGGVDVAVFNIGSFKTMRSCASIGDYRSREWMGWYSNIKFFFYNINIICMPK